MTPHCGCWYGRCVEFTVWYVVAGTLFIVMALARSTLERLPLTTSMFYWTFGLVLGPAGFALIQLDPVQSAALLERFTEVVVIISLFTAGLKLRTPLSDGRWRLPVRLAMLSMLVTVGLVTLSGVFLLGLPLGAAVLLGAIVAPTDPVLASDVQMKDPSDSDRLRFSLTGEGGLNDGTAFPFVMLGLGLLGLHEIGAGGWRWVVVDVAWATTAGLITGALFGTLIGQLVLYLRRVHKEAVGLDEFLTLGLIALSYGVALLIYSYGFLAVFAAGLALRRVEAGAAREEVPLDVVSATAAGKEEEVATDPETAPAYMAQAVLGFNEQLERIGEVVVVLLVGGMLTLQYVAPEGWWFAPLLFLVVRPVSVVIGLFGSTVSREQLRFMSWFGIRGVGSIYYLMFAIVHGLPIDIAQRLTAITLTIVAVSIVAHGISVTPLMSLYERHSRWRLRLRRA